VESATNAVHLCALWQGQGTYVPEVHHLSRM